MYLASGSAASVSHEMRRYATLIATIVLLSSQPTLAGVPVSQAVNLEFELHPSLRLVRSPHPVLTRNDLDLHDQELLVMDLAMPRVVEVALDDLAGVRRLDIYDLRDVVQRTMSDRHDAIAAAAAIVDAEVERFHVDQRSRGAAAIVAELRERLETLRRRELDRRTAVVRRKDPRLNAIALSDNVSETATPVQFTEQGDRVTCHASLVDQRSFSS